jgi:hypothetical protein
MLQRGAARISMNRLRAACLFLKGGSSAVCSVVSRWEFVSLLLLLLLLPKLQSYLPACRQLEYLRPCPCTYPTAGRERAYMLHDREV